MYAPTIASSSGLIMLMYSVSRQKEKLTIYSKDI